MSALGTSLVQQVKANKSLYRFLKPVATWYANLAGYRRYGLKYDDLIMEENNTVQKVSTAHIPPRILFPTSFSLALTHLCLSWLLLQAISRLTEREQYDRAYRFRVASQCSVLHKELPKEQWTPPEQVISSYTYPHFPDIYHTSYLPCTHSVSGIF
jgi:ubiquinol-cytochrome c reductase subunit 7